MTEFGTILTTTDLSTLTTAVAAPTGAVMPYGGDGASAPAGWVYCRGQTLDKTGSTGGVSHAALNALIGDAASPAHRFNGGSSPGANLFRVPDFQQVFAVGVDDSSGQPSGPSSANPAGPVNGGSFSDGAWDHTHSNNGSSSKLILPSHRHTKGTLATAAHNHGAGGLWNSHSHTITTQSSKIYYPYDDLTSTFGSFGINRGVDSSGPQDPTTHAEQYAITGTTSTDGPVALGETLGSATVADLELTGVTGTQNPAYLIVNYIIRL